MSVGHETNAVVEEAPAVEEGQRESKDSLELFLERKDLGALLVAELLVDVVLSKRKDGYEIGAVPNCNFDESQPAPQRKIRRARMRRERLGRAADDDCNGTALALAQDGLAAALRDTADAHGHETVAKERNGEVGREREQMRCDARKAGGELGGVCSQIRDGSDAENAVWMVAKDVRPIGWEVGGLDHGDGEVFGKVAKNGEFANPGEAAAAVFGCIVNEKDPDEIGYQNRPGERDGEEQKEDAQTDGQQQSPEEDAERLQPTTAWNRERGKAGRREQDKSRCSRSATVICMAVSQVT